MCYSEGPYEKTPGAYPSACLRSTKRPLDWI